MGLISANVGSFALKIFLLLRLNSQCLFLIALQVIELYGEGNKKKKFTIDGLSNRVQQKGIKMVTKR